MRSILVGVLFLFVAFTYCDTEGAAQLRRLRQDEGACLKVFQDASAPSVERRVAYRKLLEGTAHADATLLSALNDKDPAIRRNAVYVAFLRNMPGLFNTLKTLVADEDFNVAKMVLDCANQFPNAEQRTELLTLVSKGSKHAELRKLAYKIVDFPFNRENRRLKDTPGYDHEIVIVKSIPLALEGWKIRLDPALNGHKKGFFKPDFDDSRWKAQKIGDWESQGFPGYDGVAWYRFKFKMPAKIDSNAVELHFGAVDEVAWVWLNGVYIGQHDVGTIGWDKPFDLDVSKEIRWGEENVLCVRVEDTVAAGGIWKPVTVNVLK